MFLEGMRMRKGGIGIVKVSSERDVCFPSATTSSLLLFQSHNSMETVLKIYYISSWPPLYRSVFKLCEGESDLQGVSHLGSFALYSA
jgi:hypothetical protein